MRKKIFASAIVLVMIAAAAAAVVVLRPSAESAPVAAAPPVAAIGAPPLAPAPQAAPAPAAPAQEEAEDEAGAVTQSLKGADFLLEVRVNGNERYRDLSITMDNGVPVTHIQALEGEPGELSNAQFSRNDTFELARLIPGEAREQIVVKGDEMLNGGYGYLETYAIHRIEGERLHELFSVMTKREREEEEIDGEKRPGQYLEGVVEHTTRDGKPAIIYRVKVEKKPERTILFVWNGKQFHDPSGEYKKLAEPYMP